MPSTILRPDGDITVGLVCSTGTSHYALIDETTLDTADYNYKTSNAADTNSVSGSDLVSVGTFTRPAVIETVAVKVNITLSPGSNGGTASCTIKLYTGATELASGSGATGWNTVTYTGDLTQSQIDDLRIYVSIIVASGYYYDGKFYSYYTSTGRCNMAYVELTYSSPKTLLPSAITGSNTFGTARFKLYLKPSGITGSNTFGIARFKLYLKPASISSTGIIGTFVVVKGIGLHGRMPCFIKETWKPPIMGEF